MVRVDSNQPLIYRDSRSINSVNLGINIAAALPQLNALDDRLAHAKRIVHGTRTDGPFPRVRKETITIAKPKLSPDVVCTAARALKTFGRWLGIASVSFADSEVNCALIVWRIDSGKVAEC